MQTNNSGNNIYQSKAFCKKIFNFVTYFSRMLNKISLFVTKKLNRSNERSSNVIKNIMASFLIKGVSIAISFFLLPLTIGYVNSTQYGIWLTLSSIIAWFSFFDVGFGNGLRNRLTEAKATGNIANVKTYISTTYISVAIVFTIVWILFFLINFYIDWSLILNTPRQMAKELSLVAIITFTFFCIQIILKTINTILIADQKPAKSAFLDMLGQALTLIFILIFIKTTKGSLLYLALALGISPILILLAASLWLFSHKYKEYKPSLRLFEKSAVKDILSLGSKFFLIQIAALAIYQTTNLIIAQVSSPENVTVYNTAFRYFSVALMASGIILTPFWSAFTEAFAQKDIVWMKNTYKKLFRTVFLLCISVLVLLAISSFVYDIWLQGKVYISFNISIVVALSVISSIFASLYSHILNGIGKIKLQLNFSNACIFVNIPFSWFLGMKFGIIGVIIPSIILNILAAFLLATQVKKILNGSATGIWNK